MTKKIAILFCALVLLFCAVPMGGLGAGSFLPLKNGETLTVTGSETGRDGTEWYVVKLADGSRAYLRQDAIVSDLNAAQAETQKTQGDTVWITRSGKKYHKNSTCSGMKSPQQVTKEEAERLGYTPCKKCY